MRFWDSSALVPLLIPEAATPACARQLDADPELLVWGLTPVELCAALARRRRLGMDAALLDEAARRMADFEALWREVEEWAAVRRHAVRYLDVHPLHAGDALQLGAAFHAAAQRPYLLPFVTLDRQLAAAARAEGFEVVVPAGAP